MERLAAHADGRSIPVMSDLSLLHDSTGEPAGLRCSGTTSPRNGRSSGGRSSSRTFFDALTDSATELALVMNAEGQLIYVSPAVRRHARLRRE